MDDFTSMAVLFAFAWQTHRALEQLSDLVEDIIIQSVQQRQCEAKRGLRHQLQSRQARRSFSRVRHVEVLHTVYLEMEDIKLGKESRIVVSQGAFVCLSCLARSLVS